MISTETSPESQTNFGLAVPFKGKLGINQAIA